MAHPVSKPYQDLPVDKRLIKYVEDRRPRMWIISCHNEWCSGLQHHTVTEHPPPSIVPCPVCGWPAMLGSGIRKETQDERLHRDQVCD